MTTGGGTGWPRTIEHKPQLLPRSAEALGQLSGPPGIRSNRSRWREPAEGYCLAWLATSWAASVQDSLLDQLKIAIHVEHIRFRPLSSDPARAIWIRSISAIK